MKTLIDKLTNIDNTRNQRTAEMQQKVTRSDGVINSLKDGNQKLKNELIVVQKKVNAANLQLDDKQRTIINAVVYVWRCSAECGSASRPVTAAHDPDP